MAFSLIAHAKAGSTNMENVATPLGIDTTGSKLITLTTGQFIVTSPFTPTDTFGNTWTPGTPKGSTYQIREWYCINPITGPNHQFFLSGNTFFIYPSICMQAYSAALSISLIAENGATGAAVASLQTGAIIPSQNNALFVTGILGSQAGSVSSIDFSFSISDTVTPVLGECVALGMASLIQTAAGSVNPTWHGNQLEATAILCFQELLPVSPLVTLSLNSQAGVPGGTATLTMSLSSIGSAAPVALQLTLGLTSDVTLGTTALGAAAIAAGKLLAQSGNQIIIYGINQTVIGNGAILSITFGIVASPVATTIPITINAVVVTDGSANVIPSSTSPGSITLPGPPPPGEWFTIHSDGSITGTPTVPGIYPYTAQVTDSTGSSVTVTCMITVPGILPPGSPCDSVTAQPATDVYFEIQRLYATMKPAPRIPVRGS